MAPRIRRDDAGAYMVMYAIVGVVMFTLAAVVLDIAALRQGRRADRAAVDLAATAAAGVLDPADPTTFAPACQAAWDYVVLNRNEADGVTVPAPCAATFPNAPCDPLTPRTAAGTLGPLRISITHPVPNANSLMLGEVPGGDAIQAIDATQDGSACDRVAVRVERTRTFLFGGIAGVAGADTDVHAVARAATIGTTVAPGVVALDPTGCDALLVSPNGVTMEVAATASGGYVVADSNAGGCAGYVIDMLAPGALTVLATGPSPGVIASHAVGTGNIAEAYDAGDIAAGRLTPLPSARSAPLRRTFIDSRYAGPVTALRTALDGAAMPAPYNGVPFSTYGTLPVFPCIVAAPVVVPAGNWYVDCPTLTVDAPLTFLGGTIVFRGGVAVSDTGCFAVNSGSCGAPAVAQDNILFFRSGDLVKGEKSDFFLNRTLVYLKGGTTSVDGRLVIGPDFSGGSTDLIWTPPAGGTFEDLSLWAESGAAMNIGGQGITSTNGTFFAPNAPLTLVPRPGGSTFGGQFIARTVFVDGTSLLRIVTDATVATTIETRTVKLVR